MHKERTHNRFPLNRGVTCVVMGKPPYSPEQVPAKSEMLDLSEGGMRVRTGRLEVGSLVHVRIPVSVHGLLIPVLAEVRWTREQADGMYDAGLRFLI